MAYKVLIVDDSSFFQHRLKELINEHPDLEVIGIAANGQEGIDMEEQLRPDIISMDYEMPYLDGVSAIKAIMAKRSVPIVMFSSMTYEGATITLEALDAGAVDFIPKNFAEVSRNSAVLKKKFHEKLLTFAKNAKPTTIEDQRKKTAKLAADATERSLRAKSTTSALRDRIAQRLANEKNEASISPARPESGVAGNVTENKAPPISGKSLKGRVKIVVIAASTGGPVALTEVLTKLPANFPLPVVVIQHMPENFTKAFSERLNRQCELSVKEAENGDKLQRGHVLVAPGGKQLMFERNGTSVKIIEGDDRVNYKPCADITFVSAANIFSSSVLGVVMTGMGADGCEGAKILKQQGAFVWGQDQESCVVYGMPAAVAKAQLTDEVLPLTQIAPRLISALV